LYFPSLSDLYNQNHNKKFRFAGGRLLIQPHKSSSCVCIAPNQSSPQMRVGKLWASLQNQHIHTRVRTHTETN